MAVLEVSGGLQEQEQEQEQEREQGQGREVEEESPLRLQGGAGSGRAWGMWSRLPRVLKHPIMMMVVLILLCRVVKNGYPFNSFPMYADPSPHPSDYLIVSGTAGVPINIKKATGLSSAKVKKIYTERLNKAARRAGMDGDDATPEMRAEVFAETMKQLREEAAKRPRRFRERLMEEKVRVTNVLIHQDYTQGAVFREVPEVLGEEK